VETVSIFAAVGSILFAISGACAKWISKAEERQQVTLLGEIVIAIFTGGLTFAVFTSQGLDIYLMFTVSGFLGWLGASSVDILGRWVMKRFGIELPVENEESGDK